MPRPQADTIREFAEWLQKQGKENPTVIGIFGAFNKFLNDAAFEVFRSNFASRSLHPQFGAVSLIWSDTDDLPLPPPGNGISNVQKVTVPGGFVNHLRFLTVNTDAPGFLSSPMAPVILHGRIVREKISPLLKSYKYPIISDLQALGGTDYIAMPVRFRENIEGFMSFASRKAGGFSDSEIVDLKIMASLFAMALDGRLKDELIGTLLRLYLGDITGAQVLAGRIRRGDMENIESAIWFSDIRGFSALSSIMQPAEIIELLNSYYESVIPVVHEYGGEVLKFLGDGMLVIFNAREGKERQARYQSLIAANAAQKALDKLNERRVEEGKIPLRHGIGLHYGRIQYGNIGSDDRLDFTVIGTAVNTASRVAALCAELAQPVLISGTLAGLMRLQLTSHGLTELKGIPQPVEIFSLPAATRQRKTKN